jgi:glycosyltransferase involved in cell wall biosynthesis
LVIIGRFVENKHREYSTKFKNVLKRNAWIKHVESVPYEFMPAYYKFAKVGVSASWFESTGLTSLEALYCGTNAVASGDQAREYLGEYATYCQPDDVDSIKEAIKTEYNKPRPVIDEVMIKSYTWQKAAQETLEVYEKLTS